MQYTYDRYREFLERILGCGFQFRSFESDPDAETVFLRHDVDWSPRKALTMAEIEAEIGVSSTFFFLTTSPMYNPLNDRVREVVAAISDLGHRVGLHFDTHQYWDEEPAAEALGRRVAFERSVLAGVTDPVTTAVSFHNPPEWVLNTSFDGFVNTYATRFLSDIGYTADSNQRWASEEPWPAGEREAVQVLTHPVLWGDEPGSTVERLEGERRAVVDDLDAYLTRMNDEWPGDG